MPFPSAPTFQLAKVNRDQIVVAAEACTRVCLFDERIDTLRKRIDRGAHFPPIILWRSCNGTLTLIDGFHRLAAFARLGTNPISAVIVDEDLATALVAGLRENAPKEGKLRTGPDAHRAITLLAAALGRKITEAEAESVGIVHSEHFVLPRNAIEAFSTPQLPRHQNKTQPHPTGRTNPRKRATHRTRQKPA